MPPMEPGLAGHPGANKMMGASPALPMACEGPSMKTASASPRRRTADMRKSALAGAMAANALYRSGGVREIVEVLSRAP